VFAECTEMDDIAYNHNHKRPTERHRIGLRRRTIFLRPFGELHPTVGLWHLKSITEDRYAARARWKWMLLAARDHEAKRNHQSRDNETRD